MLGACNYIPLLIVAQTINRIASVTGYMSVYCKFAVTVFNHMSAPLYSHATTYEAGGCGVASTNTLLLLVA